MIIIHGYRATTILLSILLNVMVRTGEYGRYFPPSDKVLSTTIEFCLLLGRGNLHGIIGYRRSPCYSYRVLFGFN